MRIFLFISVKKGWRDEGLERAFEANKLLGKGAIGG
jgi:hypothetical protein